MTRIMSLLTLALPLAFVAGCVDGIGTNPDNCVDGDCSDTNDCTGDDCVGNEDFLATLHVIAPNDADYMADAPDDFEFRGDFKIGFETHEDTSECWYDVEEPTSELFVSFTGDGFRCGWHDLNIGSADNGLEIDVTWDGVAPWIDEDGGPTCALDPDGEYASYNVRTSHNDEGQVVIGIGTMPDAPIVGNQFYLDTEDAFLAGEVAWDLSEITYHVIIYNDGEVHFENEDTIELND